MNFFPHPFAGQSKTYDTPLGPFTIDFPEQSFTALTDKYSFLVMHYVDTEPQNPKSEVQLLGWWISWNDRYNGGSASITREGPFKTRYAAETRCRVIYKELLMKN